MQRRPQFGSSGELDVFGATRYFHGAGDRATAGAVAAAAWEPRDLAIFQVKLHTPELKKMEEERSCQARQLGGSKTARSRSKLASFLSSLMSSPDASFRKKPPSPAIAPAAADEPPKVSSSSSDVTAASAASVQGCGGHDLGVTMGDRRLHGVRVVRGSGDEERWVVKCCAWDEEEEEEHHDKMFDATSSDHQAGEEEGGGLGWESDSSSDLFELELDDMIFPASNY